MELATNKHMLLASPDAGVVTDLTDPEGVDKWSGENRNSAIALNTETDEVMPLVSELEQIEKMQRQLSRMQQDTATLQAALHHKMSRVWVDSNPDRPDQSIVSRSETADNRCPKNLGQPFNKACLDPGTADLRIMQDNDTNHLWPGLVTQGLDLPERLHRPPLSSRHPNHPSGYEAPSEEEADTAQALLQLAGASEGGTRQFGTSKRDFGLGVAMLDEEVEGMITDLEQEQGYGKSVEEVSKHLGHEKVSEGEIK